jgi:Protein of unknown function (DUF1569)
MSVDTKNALGRRTLRFTTLEEVIADSEKLVSSPHTRMLGNWPLDRLLTHLAHGIDSSIDGSTVQAPRVVRLIAPFFKGRILRNGMSAGTQLPKQAEVNLYPEVGSPREALERLRAAVGRLRNERMTACHPVFGKITPEEWLQLHLRHSELHLSFALPS